MQTPRFFNTAGPVNCEDHYCLPPLQRSHLEKLDWNRPGTLWTPAARIRGISSFLTAAANAPGKRRFSAGRTPGMDGRLRYRGCKDQ